MITPEDERKALHNHAEELLGREIELKITVNVEVDDEDVMIDSIYYSPENLEEDFFDIDRAISDKLKQLIEQKEQENEDEE